MSSSTLVQDVMTPLADVVSFRPEDRIEDAARRLSERRLGGGPVVDDAGRIVGALSDDDLIVQESQLHMPTVITVLGAYIELPSSHAHFEEDLRKAVGATVGDVMDDEPRSCRPNDTLEHVATVMHKENVSRLAVVDDDDRLVGVIARGDLVRALVAPDG
jgi:CBS domain-containing protein